MNILINPVKLVSGPIKGHKRNNAEQDTADNHECYDNAPNKD